MRYIIWVMALLDTCDVTNNGRHLGFYQELEIRLKPREIVTVVSVLYMKNNTQISTLHDFSLKIYFYCWKKLKKKKNMYFHPTSFPERFSQSHVNWAMRRRLIFTQKWLGYLLLMTSNLVTTATDHHWTCLKMCARDERTATENVRWWCFILYEKLQQEKNLTARGGHPLPLVRPRVKMIKFGKNCITSNRSHIIRRFPNEMDQTIWFSNLNNPLSESLLTLCL